MLSCAMPPTMPHMGLVGAVRGGGGAAAFFFDLGRAGDGQGVGRDGAGDGGARGDVRAVADAEGGDELAVGADEDVVANVGAVFLDAVVVAGDDARADVAVGADVGIAQIGEVARFYAAAQAAVFDFDKIADAGGVVQRGARAQAGVGADDAVRADGG